MKQTDRGEYNMFRLWAKEFKDNEIIEVLHWNKKKSFKFVVSNNFDDFIKIYKEYLDLIICFLKGT